MSDQDFSQVPLEEIPERYKAAHAYPDSQDFDSQGNDKLEPAARRLKKSKAAQIPKLTDSQVDDYNYIPGGSGLLKGIYAENTAQYVPTTQDKEDMALFAAKRSKVAAKREQEEKAKREQKIDLMVAHFLAGQERINEINDHQNTQQSDCFFLCSQSQLPWNRPVDVRDLCSQFGKLEIYSQLSADQQALLDKIKAEVDEVEIDHNVPMPTQSYTLSQLLPAEPQPVAKPQRPAWNGFSADQPNAQRCSEISEESNEDCSLSQSPSPLRSRSPFRPIFSQISSRKPSQRKRVSAPLQLTFGDNLMSQSQFCVSQQKDQSQVSSQSQGTVPFKSRVAQKRQSNRKSMPMSGRLIAEVEAAIEGFECLAHPAQRNKENAASNVMPGVRQRLRLQKIEP